jgi:DNA-binding MarR family transcriptional regulator
LYRLIVAIRIAFNRLKGVSDELNRDLGINVSARGVLESLANGSLEKSVPLIAREKGVSRQHIQLIVDALLDRSLVKVVDNPAHKRSPLIVLTAEGAQIFAEIRRREADMLEILAKGLDRAALAGAAAALEALNTRLTSLERSEDDAETA